MKFESAIEHDVECVVRDGTVLRADVYKPVPTGRYPTLVCRTPYDKTITRYVEVAEDLAAHGYCVVVQDARGRHASEGEFKWMYGPSAELCEAEDGFDTIEWAARLPFSNGHVGAFGHSYDGWAIWMLLAEAPPSLEAAFVSGICQNLRSMTFGIFETGRRLEWTYTLAGTDRRPPDQDPDRTLSRSEAARRWHEVERGKYLWFLPLGDLPDEPFGNLAGQLKDYLQNAHADTWDFGPTHEKVSIPLMHMTGWWDRLVGTIDNHVGAVGEGVEEVRHLHRLIVGPWGHDPTDLSGRLGPVDYGPGADRTYAQLVRRWFDLHLKGEDDGIGDEEPVQLFVVGENAWRGFSEWPPATTETALYLWSGGSANTVDGDGVLTSSAPGGDATPSAKAAGDDRSPVGSAQYDSFVYDPRDPLMSLMRADSQVVPVDQAPHDRRSDAVVYQTPLLEEALTLIGSPTLVLWAATDGPDTDWTARLAVVYADGLAVNLTYGIVRAQFRHGADRPELLVPNEVYEYRIVLNPVGIRLEPGQRLRLYVSSSDFPNFDRNHNTGEPFWADTELRPARQRVYHSAEYPSRLVLPVEHSSEDHAPRRP